MNATGTHNHPTRHLEIPHNSDTAKRRKLSTAVAPPSQSPLSSYTYRHRAGRDNANFGSPSMTPEKAMDTPASQPAITTSIALAENTSLSLENMKQQLSKLTYKLYHTIVHETQVIHSLSVLPSWQRIKSQFIRASPEEVDASIQTVMAPLKQCIHTHYERLVDNIHQEITNCPIRTYQTMYEHNPDKHWPTIEASIAQL